MLAFKAARVFTRSTVHGADQSVTYNTYSFSLCDIVNIVNIFYSYLCVLNIVWHCSNNISSQ